MGIIVDFAAEAASRRLGARPDAVSRDGLGTILILPVVRIERDGGATDGNGPEHGAAPGGGRRKRARS